MTYRMHKSPPQYRMHIKFPDGESLITDPQPNARRLAELAQFIFVEQGWKGVTITVEEVPSVP